MLKVNAQDYPSTSKATNLEINKITPEKGVILSLMSGQFVMNAMLGDSRYNMHLL